MVAFDGIIKPCVIFLEGLADDDDDDDNDAEVKEFTMINHREPYRIIKQETRLPTIQETSPPKPKNKQNGKIKNGGMKLKGRQGSKTNLLNTDDQYSETSLSATGETGGNGDVYTNVSLSDDEDVKKMNFEML